MLGFQGAKGGSGGSFKQRPDTLRSTDTFEGLLGLCAGPVKGLTRGLKSLKIDGTPLEDESGRLNFENFVAIFADGNPASFPQPVDLRLGAGGSPVAVNLALSNTAPSGPGPWITKSVANLNADFLDLRFLVNQLYRQDKSGIYEHTANIEVQLKPTGAVNWISPMLGTPSQSWSQSGTPTSGPGVRLFIPQVYYDIDGGGGYRPETNSGYFKIYGKTSSVAVHELRIAVPNDGAYADRGWDIRCRLIEKESVDADPNFEKRNITWESVTAGYNTKLGVTEPWRGLSWLQLYGKASDQLTGVPSVTGEYDTLIVPVPPSGVFDPENRTYTGAIWDGSWAQAFTTDPAWNINGLLTNSLFGLASISPGAKLNKWDALEASKWFSAPVPDGAGGFEPRSSLNIALNEPQKASEFVPYLAGAVGALAWEEGNGEWRLKVDKPEAATDIFTLETIVDEFAYSHTNVDTRFNDITYVFRNKEFDYREDRVRVVDSEHIDRFGRKPTTIVGIGCTGRQEAIRRAIMRLRVATRETRSVRFVTNRRGRLVQPLSTILVADGDLGFLTELDENTRSTGRIINVAADRLSFEVRDPLHLELGVAYSVTFTTPNPDYAPDADVDREGVNTTSPTLTQTIALTNSAAQRGNVTTVYLADPLPVDVAPNANIALSADDLPTLPKPYRVTSVEPSGESIAISAIEIDSGKWDASDNGEAEFGYVPPTDAVVPPVENATITLSQFPSENQLVTVLNVAWDRPASNMLAGYRVEQRLNGGEWQVLNARTNLNALERVNPQFGVWDFRITSVDRRERTSEPVIVSTEVNEAALAEAGPYDNTKTYYYGQIVSISDGSRWRYNNSTATSGNDPEEGSDYWVRLSDAATGPSGSSVAMVFKRSATQPAMPTPGASSPPAGGWYDDIASVPIDDEPLWASIGFRSDETSFWLWNTPIKVEGQDGAPGAPGADGQTLYTWYAYADAPDGTFNFTTGAPGTRVYQGIAVNKTTAVESTNPADYVWSQYAGPPNFGLAAFNSNTPLAGNKLIKASGGSAWGNASIHSTESFKNGATVSFVVDTDATFVVGLNTDPTTDAHYTSIDFGIYCSSGSSSALVRESGTIVFDSGVDIVVGDVFTITYNNKTVVYSKNGVPFYTNYSPPAGLTLFLDSSLFSNNISFGRIVSFGPAGQAGIDGAPGTAGAPGAPGADGITYYTHYAYADAPDGTFNFTTGLPGDRTYQGVRYNQTSETESTDPADYVWSPYVGPPNFGLAAFNSNSVVAGNKLIKVAGGVAWNASIHSTESFKGGATVSAVIDDPTKSFMIGLNTDPTADASYESIDFAIYVYAGNDIQAYENGAPVAGMGFTAPAAGDVITVTYNEKSVIYSKNGVVFHTNVSPPSGLTLFLDSSINDVGHVGRILSFNAAGPAGADGVEAWTPSLIGGSYARSGGNFTGVFEIRSSESVPQARASGRLAATDDSTGIGLYDPSTGDLYELITYAAWGTDARLHHYGVSQAPTGVTAAVGQTWEVAHIGDQIRAFIDGVDVGQIGPGVPADRALMASFRTGGASKTIENCVFARGGAPGISPLLITLSPQSLTVQGAPGGGPASGELPKYAAVTAQRGGVAKTVTAISVTAVSNCTASVSGTNVSLNTAGAGDAEITISVTADGETQTGIKIPVTVVPSGADGDVAATITTNTPQITSSTYAAWSPTLAVNASSTGKLKVSGLCRYRVPLGLGSLQVQAKLQISANGSSWTDVSGSQVTGTTSETLEDPERVVNGVATFPEITVTGLTADGAYQVRAQLRKVSSGDTNSESITLRIVGERVT